jgi:hypothetical protein
MRNRKISKELQMKVLKYLDYLNKREDDGFEKGEEILKLISQDLRAEVSEEFYGKILK